MIHDNDIPLERSTVRADKRALRPYEDDVADFAALSREIVRPPSRLRRLGGFILDVMTPDPIYPYMGIHHSLGFIPPRDWNLRQTPEPDHEKESD